jgi:hypothetical protein
VRVLRVARLVAAGLTALAVLASVAMVFIVAALHAATVPQQAAAAILRIAAVVFVSGGILTLASSVVIRFLEAKRDRSRSVAVGAVPSGAYSLAGDAPIAEFRPMGIGLARGLVPVSSSLPWGQRFAIYSDGLDLRNLFAKVWIPRDRILDLYPVTGGFRVIWDDGDRDSSAVLSDWFYGENMRMAMVRAGYRFDER